MKFSTNWIELNTSSSSGIWDRHQTAVIVLYIWWWLLTVLTTTTTSLLHWSACNVNTEKEQAKTAREEKNATRNKFMFWVFWPYRRRWNEIKQKVIISQTQVGWLLATPSPPPYIWILILLLTFAGFPLPYLSIYRHITLHHFIYSIIT